MIIRGAQFRVAQDFHGIDDEPEVQRGIGIVRMDVGGRGLPQWLVGCYHPSRQNTNTGKLTAVMIDEVIGEAKRLLDRDELRRT